jgi:hypothetical protein
MPDLRFKFHLILINLNNYMSLVAMLLTSTVLEHCLTWVKSLALFSKWQPVLGAVWMLELVNTVYKQAIASYQQ